VLRLLPTVRMSVGRLFEAAGPTTLNNHSPNLSVNCGMSRSFFLLNADLSVVRIVWRQAVAAQWMTRHNLYILAWISSQCNTMVLSMTRFLSQGSYNSCIAADCIDNELNHRRFGFSSIQLQSATLAIQCSALVMVQWSLTSVLLV